MSYEPKLFQITLETHRGFANIVSMKETLMTLVTVPTNIHGMQCVGGFLLGSSDRELGEHFAQQLMHQSKKQGLEESMLNTNSTNNQEMNLSIPIVYIVEIAKLIAEGAEKNQEAITLMEDWLPFIEAGRKAFDALTEGEDDFGGYKEFEAN